MQGFAKDTLFKYAAGLLSESELALTRESIAGDDSSKRFVEETRRQILGSQYPELDWEEPDVDHVIQQKLINFAAFQLDEAEFLRMAEAVKGSREIKEFVALCQNAFRLSVKVASQFIARSSFEPPDK